MAGHKWRACGVDMGMRYSFISHAVSPMLKMVNRWDTVHSGCSGALENWMGMENCVMGNSAITHYPEHDQDSGAKGDPRSQQAARKE